MLRLLSLVFYNYIRLRIFIITIICFSLILSPGFFSYNYSSCINLIDTRLGDILVLLTLVLFFFSLVVVIKFTDPTIIFLCVFIQIVLVLTFKVRKVLMFYFSFEASIIPMLLIIIKRGYRPERYTAALWIVVYTVAGRLPFLFIILISFSRRLVTSMEGGVKGFIFSLVVLMPFIVKFPLFGVHYWLPLAHVEAPLVGRILLAGILLKLGGYGFFVLLTIFNLRGIFLTRLVIWSLTGRVVVCFHIISSPDIKKLIALRRVAHINVSIVGLRLNRSSSVISGKIILVSHGLCRALIFYLANSGYLVRGSRSLIIIKGMLNIIPIFCLWLILYCSVNIGVPPSLSFIRELLLCPGLLYISSWGIILLIIGLFIAASYSIYLYYAVCHGFNNEWRNKSFDLKSSDHILLRLSLIGSFTLIFLVDLF